MLLRGRRRFIVLVKSGGLNVERVRDGRFPSKMVFYSVSEREKQTLTVVKKATPRTRARARKIVEESCSPWMRVEWCGEAAIYVPR